MAISSLDQYIAAPKQRVNWNKTGTRTLVAAMPYSVFGVAGNPGAGTEAAGNTANGIVPTDVLAGYPSINSFGVDAKGYITRVEYTSSVACTLCLYDELFRCGGYNYNADVNLSDQPSFASRVPGGNDYGGLQIWVKTLVAPTGDLAVQVNYLDQGGDAGDTGAVGIGAAPAVGRMWQLPLAAGDSGIQKITRVRGSVATAGNACFEVSVLRLLGIFRVASANGGGILDLLGIGMPEVFADSALFMSLAADSTAVGLPYVDIEIANG